MNSPDRVATMLLAYCRSRHWSGHDPYDALNSPLLRMFPVVDRTLPRLAMTQALKRSPINLRYPLGIPETQNPKALGLFLTALLKAPHLWSADAPQLPRTLIDLLVGLRSPGRVHWCWGYSFPWQTRTLLVPRGAPNLVCTTFVANALLDGFDNGCGDDCLEMAVGAANYLVEELYWEHGEAAGFSYPHPSVRVPIHNAHFLAAALLVRVSALTGDRRYDDVALRVARYSASRQRHDGSWTYGEASTQQWVDNFHTGYNLCALHQVGRDLGTTEFEGHVAAGFDFYRRHFFTASGAPRYYHDRLYPIDIHSVAQSIITLHDLAHLDSGNLTLAASVLNWAVANMWDERGFFYYRILRFLTIRTSYMRWSQAWMLLALATALRAHRDPLADSGHTVRALPPSAASAPILR